jgi:hypothetical protein
MDFDANMVCNQSNNALAIRVGNAMIGRAKPFGQTIYPQSPIRIEHDLDDLRIVKVFGDGPAKRGAQHAAAARKCL